MKDLTNKISKNYQRLNKNNKNQKVETLDFNVY